jgi:hypothetical protein
MNDSLEQPCGVGLFGKSARFIDSGEITNQCRAGAGHGAYRVLGTLLVAAMQDDIMA